MKRGIDMGNTRKQRVTRNGQERKEDFYTSAAFEMFIKEKEALGLTQDTLKAYRVTFDKFEDYFGDKVERVGDITSSLFIDWTNAMRNDGLATATINHHLGGIRPFMYWCMEDIRQYVPYFRIRLVKRQEEPPKDYTNEEVHKLLNKPKKDAKFTEWRSWAIVQFIMGTGARCGTLIEIQMQDIDLKEAKVFYRHTKNKKLQTANMPPQLVKSLSEYINIWRHNAQEDDYLFCTLSNEKIGRHSIKAAFGAYTKSRGVEKTSLHGLRHTFAREWYLGGGDVVQLSKVLGHSTIHMSEHYMNVYADSAKDKFVQCNPLENMARARGNARKTVTRNG
jgi:integrase/recombinase XerD